MWIEGERGVGVVGRGVGRPVARVTGEGVMEGRLGRPDSAKAQLGRGGKGPLFPPFIFLTFVLFLLFYF